MLKANFIPIHGFAPLGIKFEDLCKTINADLAENVVGQFMNPWFFRHSFFWFGIETLQKLAEADDMNKLMGEDVECKGEQLQLLDFS